VQTFHKKEQRDEKEEEEEEEEEEEGLLGATPLSPSANLHLATLLRQLQRSIHALKFPLFLFAPASWR